MIFFTYLGDLLSRPLLECLVKIAELYGEHFILIQYMPYCWDLAGLCKRKVSQNLEGGLLGSLAVLHAIIPLLSDSVLMKVSIIKNKSIFFTVMDILLESSLSLVDCLPLVASSAPRLQPALDFLNLGTINGILLDGHTSLLSNFFPYVS